MQNIPPLITLSMIVRNEEKYLSDCLESVKGLADEIVLVDTGSTDGTLKIAEEYGASIYHFDWIGDFSAARNFALSKSNGRWVLYLDADERISKESLRKIKQLTERGLSRKRGVRCLVNSIDDKHGKPKLMRYTRLFMNSAEISFSGKVHEQIDQSLLSNGYEIIDSDVEIIHVGYNIDTSGLKQKASRNLELLIKEYSENRSGYYAFQLANTYEILEDMENAFSYFTLALEDGKLDRSYKSVCHLKRSFYYESLMQDNSKAESEVILGLKNSPDDPQLNLLASRIYQKTGQWQKAFGYCREALKANKLLKQKRINTSTLSIYIKPEKIISHGLCLAIQLSDKNAFDYFIRETPTEAGNIYMRLLNNKPIDKEVNKIPALLNEDNIYLFLMLLENYADRKAALEILLQVRGSFSHNAKFLTTLGNCLISCGEAENGIKALLDSLELSEKDPSAIFYLIAALINKNDLTDIPALLAFAQKEFGHITLFMEKFKILKQKLETITS